jgi:glucan 1,3-beta-glucosidase
LIASTDAIAARFSNAFAYWQGQDISNASATFIDDIQQSLGRVQSVRGSLDGVEFAVGETGAIFSGPSPPCCDE